MNITESVKLLKQYSICINCGNDKIGNGEGTVNINGNIFERTCKCGWSIKVENKQGDEQQQL